MAKKKIPMITTKLILLFVWSNYIQNEIEVALRHNGTGYVALGWRPSQGIDGTCRTEAPGNFPLGMCDIHMVALLELTNLYVCVLIRFTRA